jgi:hypothetical protein
LVCRMNGFFALDLDHDFVVDYHVRAEAAVELDRVVKERDWFLTLYTESYVFKFVGQARLLS